MRGDESRSIIIVIIIRFLCRLCEAAPRARVCAAANLWDGMGAAVCEPDGGRCCVIVIICMTTIRYDDGTGPPLPSRKIEPGVLVPAKSAASLAWLLRHETHRASHTRRHPLACAVVRVRVLVLVLLAVLLLLLLLLLLVLVLVLVLYFTGRAAGGATRWGLWGSRSLSCTTRIPSLEHNA